MFDCKNIIILFPVNVITWRYQVTGGVPQSRQQDSRSHSHQTQKQHAVVGDTGRPSEEHILRQRDQETRGSTLRSFKSLERSHLESPESRKSNFSCCGFFCVSCHRQFMSFTGESRISSKISNLHERLEHFFYKIMQRNQNF